jgi:hypothetical protein
MSEESVIYDDPTAITVLLGTGQLRTDTTCTLALPLVVLLKTASV